MFGCLGVRVPSGALPVAVVGAPAGAPALRVDENLSLNHL
jgi:hypothetical protein